MDKLNQRLLLKNGPGICVLEYALTFAVIAVAMTSVVSHLGHKLDAPFVSATARNTPVPASTVEQRTPAAHEAISSHNN